MVARPVARDVEHSFGDVDAHYLLGVLRHGEGQTSGAAAEIEAAAGRDRSVGKPGEHTHDVVDVDLTALVERVDRVRREVLRQVALVRQHTEVRLMRRDEGPIGISISNHQLNLSARSTAKEARKATPLDLRAYRASVDQSTYRVCRQVEIPLFAARCAGFARALPAVWHGEYVGGPRRSERQRTDDGFISVDELMKRHTVEELAESADQYFARLGSWDTQLAKPFASSRETPELLVTFGALLSGLDLQYGMRVLDFGVGSGWTSWIMSQLGCEVIASDVSATALKMAAERYARLPLIGEVPEPVFSHFDGHRFGLDDGSVERIVCNDAFHHVANPAEVLAEFARVLTPGGVCVMSEPGPTHSRSTGSQAEMRSFRVVERDIIVEDIAAQAYAVGFDSVGVGVYCGLPQFVDASHFDAALDPASPLPNDLTRTYLANRRLIRLHKTGEESGIDSLRRDALAGSLRVDLDGDVVRIRVENTGPATWLQRDGVGLVSVGAHLFASDGALIDFDFMRVRLAADETPIGPGVEKDVVALLPSLGAGEFRIEFDLVSEHIAWFAEHGNPTVTIPVRRTVADSIDSRRLDALGGSLLVDLDGDVVRVRVKNTGAATWLQRDGVGAVFVGAHLFASDGELIDFDFLRIPLGAGETPIEPGAEIEAIGNLPKLGPGEFQIEFDLVSEHIAWFADNGNATVTIPVRR